MQRIRTNLKVLRGDFLGATEDIAFGAALGIELVQLHHRAKRDQPNQGVGRKQAE